MKRAIATADAPAAIGTYSQAIAVDGTVYLSGQIPLDPHSMTLVDGGFRDQAEQVLRNLAAVAKACGGSLDDLVKVTVYLVDLGDFPVLNEVMQAHFSTPHPARATVGVNELPKGARVEIEGILVLPSGDRAG